jgi:hypothetical protein
MNVQSSNLNLTTPLSLKNLSFCKTEDSGYHTSFASSSLECSNLCNESLEPSLVLPNYCKIQVECYPLTPNSDVRPTASGRYSCSRPKGSNGNFDDTPILKRGIKRPYEENIGQNGISFTVTTPTSIIASEVQKLKVNDTKINTTTSSCDSGHLDSFLSDAFFKDYYGSAVTYPTTPIKKICRSSCNLSPFSCRKSARKVDFSIHSLSCEGHVLKLQQKPQQKVLKSFVYKPDERIDIIKLLYKHEDYCSTSIRKILSYLPPEDEYKFTLVSPTWCSIYKSTNTKQYCQNFFETLKSNLENLDHGETPKISDNNQIGPLKEIQNINTLKSTLRSPIRSPRTTKFNKYTKVCFFTVL